MDKYVDPTNMYILQEFKMNCLSKEEHIWGLIISWYIKRGLMDQTYGRSYPAKRCKIFGISV